MIDKMLIRGAKVHNLKNIDLDIPLGKIVGIAGVSGSGKSSLALGVLYAEGSRRYLEALSTYTRRRMTQAVKASVDEVLYVPAALALHQRPGVPGIRSTFGTGTELLNSLRLMYSRLASHRCPNGHYLEPTLLVAAGKKLTCPECGAQFYAPSAEELAFNSQGACKTCSGTGSVRTVDLSTLVPDESLTIEQGAVAPWNSLMWSLMTDVCKEMGVRIDVPFRELTEQEKDIVYHGPAEKKHILYHPKKSNSNDFAELDFTYFNAVYTVENALAKVKDEKGMKRVEKFLKEDICPDCHGTRLSAAARAPKLLGISLDEACSMTLAQLVAWVQRVPNSLPEAMRPMAERICEAFTGTAKRLMDLGLGYLTLDRSAATLSTGERQRMQLARAVRNRTTGVLYVLDEPSSNLDAYAIADFRQLLFTLKSQGKTIIISEHRLYYLSGLFDRVLYLKDGEIEGDYTAEEFCGLSAKQRDDMGLRPLDLAGLSEVEGTPQRMNEAVWTIKNVSFAYKHEPETLHITETSFPSGSATAIIGHNGAGKSTFARCLCGLEKHFKGTVQDQSKNYSRKERLKLCYMVMQDVNHQLFTESVLDEILLSMRTENKQRAREILKEMDLLSFEDSHPMGLSGGQKQRVAVASAIASERPLILFDEPTSGLDLFHMRQVANVVNQVANAGRTALVVTHDPEFILRCCNYVLHLENGQIQESYSIEDSNGRKRLLKFFLSDMKKEVSTE